MAKDIKIDRTFNDVILVGGDIPFITKKEVLRQRLEIRLLTPLGDFFLNTLFGIPLFTKILGKGRSVEEIEDIYKTRIITTPDVTKLVDFSSDFEQKIRKFFIEFRVNSTFGDIEGRTAVGVL